MAELDIKGFVTPEQQLNFDKLAETLNAQSAAKLKAEETKATKKAALQKAFEGKFETKDYLTGTVHDPHITERLFDAKEKVNQFIQENPNASVSDIELFANPIIRGVATDSEKLKELERQRKIGEAYVSKIPGADPVKFNEYFKKTALLSPDGTIPDDLSGLDMTKDYGTYVLNNAPIWNTGAIDNLVAKAGSGKSTESILVKGADKKIKSTKIDIESPLHMKPVLDKSGHFTGDFEMPHVLYKDNGIIVEQDVIDESTGKPKLDAQGNKIKEPIKMLELDDYKSIMLDVGTKGYIEQKIREVGLKPETTAGQNYGRKVGFDVVNASSKAKTRFSEAKKDEAAPAPVIKTTVNVGGKEAGTEVRDLYTPALERYQFLQSKKNKVADLIKQGKTDAEIANIVGLAESAVKSSRLGRNKARMPLNMQDLDVEFVNSIVDNVGKSRKYTSANEEDKERNYTADNLAVEVNDKGNFEVYTFLPGKKDMLLTTIPKTSLNWKAQSGAKPRQALVEQEKKGTSKKTASPKMKKVTDEETLRKLNEEK
jgi:hypothetical protein